MDHTEYTYALYQNKMKSNYDSRIQIDKNVIDDVFQVFHVFRKLNKAPKMLVFGLGYDSKLWYHGNNGNTFFIEDNDEYISLGKKSIPSDHIFKYNYDTTCRTSMRLTDSQIREFKIPTEIARLTPFDIIIIDGPAGWRQDAPGRLIPIYWSTLLSKPGTIIYVDDSDRNLEKYCIEKFLGKKIQIKFQERNGCTKIIF